jgi:hypothetical protein
MVAALATTILSMRPIAGELDGSSAPAEQPLPAPIAAGHRIAALGYERLATSHAFDLLVLDPRPQAIAFIAGLAGAIGATDPLAVVQPANVLRTCPTLQPAY